MPRLLPLLAEAIVSKTEPAKTAEKIRITMTVLARKVTEIRIRQACPLPQSKAENTYLERDLIELHADKGYMEGNLTDLF